MSFNFGHGASISAAATAAAASTGGAAGRGRSKTTTSKSLSPNPSPAGTPTFNMGDPGYGGHLPPWEGTGAKDLKKLPTMNPYQPSSVAGKDANETLSKLVTAVQELQETVVDSRRITMCNISALRTAIETEEEARKAEVAEVREIAMECARAINTPFLELKGKDLPRRGQKGGAVRGEEAALFARLVDRKYGIAVDPSKDIIDAFYSGPVLVAKFNDLKKGSAFFKLIYRPGNWWGKEEAKTFAVSLERKRTKVETEWVGRLSFLRRKDSNKQAPRVAQVKHLTAGVAYKESKEAGSPLIFVKALDDIKRLGSDEEWREYDTYRQEQRKKWQRKRDDDAMQM